MRRAAATAVFWLELLENQWFFFEKHAVPAAATTIFSRAGALNMRRAAATAVFWPE